MEGRAQREREREIESTQRKREREKKRDGEHTEIEGDSPLSVRSVHDASPLTLP